METVRLVRRSDILGFAGTKMVMIEVYNMADLDFPAFEHLRKAHVWVGSAYKDTPDWPPIDYSKNTISCNSSLVKLVSYI